MSDIVAMTLEELQGCEVVIKRGKQAFIEVGEALREIKERKGYKLNYRTFEEYCKQRWGFTANYARRQIKSSETVKLLQKSGAPGHENLTEKQLRPITTLPPEQQVAFVETHDITEMSAKDIARAVKEPLADNEPKETINFIEDPFGEGVSIQEAPCVPKTVEEELESVTSPEELSNEALIKLCHDLMVELDQVVEENKVLREENARLKSPAI
jgi:hypothetical protein